jgi:Protein of unknown function (DUF3489)
MSKPLKKRTASSTNSTAVAKGSQSTPVDLKNTNPASKQSRVISILQSPEGATIDAMMKATGWQQHSVRGFLAGVVRKRLKLRLESNKVNGTRVYLIAKGDGGNQPRQAKRQPSS